MTCNSSCCLKVRSFKANIFPEKKRCSRTAIHSIHPTVLWSDSTYFYIRHLKKNKKYRKEFRWFCFVVGKHHIPAPQTPSKLPSKTDVAKGLFGWFFYTCKYLTFHQLQLIFQSNSVLILKIWAFFPRNKKAVLSSSSQLNCIFFFLERQKKKLFPSQQLVCNFSARLPQFISIIPTQVWALPPPPKRMQQSSCKRQDIDYDHHSQYEKLTVRRTFNELVLQTHEKCSFNSNSLSIYHPLKLSQGPNYFTKLISEKSQWTNF